MSLISTIYFGGFFYKLNTVVLSDNS